MRQCRQHGTKLPDGTPIVITEVVLNGRRYQRGVCKHCNRTKAFAHKPKPLTSETYDRIIY